MIRNIGIDIGSSFIKICLLSDDTISNIKRVKSPSSGPLINGRHEVDTILFLEIITNLINEYILNFDNIKGIYVSTQMHGFVLVDELDNACSNFISWKDRRSDEFIIGNVNAIDWMKNNIPSGVLLKTGMGVRSGLPSVNLFVLQRQGKIKSNMSFGTIGDYLVSSLTNTSISTSVSNAAGSGLFDLENNCWNSEIIDLLELKINLPLICNTPSLPIGFYKDVKVFSAIGDQQASLLGLESDLLNIAVSNIATGSQATVSSSKLVLNNKFQTRPYVNSNYILTIPFIPAGRVLNSLVNLLMEINNNFFSGNMKVEEVWENLVDFTNKIDLDQEIAPTLKINTDFIGSFSINGGSIKSIDESNFKVTEVILAFILDIVNNHAIALEELSKYKFFETVLISGGISQRLPIIKKALESKIDEKVVVSSISEDALNGLRVLSIDNIETW
jgi:sugar (pentulose or hexulose) kinase